MKHKKERRIILSKEQIIFILWQENYFQGKTTEYIQQFKDTHLREELFNIMVKHGQD